MDLTLDYNIELFPLQNGQSFALALASSLSRNPQGPAGTAEDEDKDRDVWRPDAKGRRGLDDDYEYVMYGKVCRAMFSHASFPHHPLSDVLNVATTYPTLRPLPSILFRIPETHLVLKVYRFDGGSAEIVWVSYPFMSFVSSALTPLQDGIRVLRWTSHVPNRIVQAFDQHRARRPCIHTSASMIVRAYIESFVLLPGRLTVMGRCTGHSWHGNHWGPAALAV